MRLERETGFEPAALCLGSKCATIAPLPLRSEVDYSKPPQVCQQPLYLQETLHYSSRRVPAVISEDFWECLGQEAPWERAEGRAPAIEPMRDESADRQLSSKGEL